MLRRPRDKLGNTCSRLQDSSKSINNNKQNIYAPLNGRERERGITMMNFTELLAMNNFMTSVTSSITISDNEVKKTKEFKEKKAAADKNNAIWNNAIAVINAANTKISDADAEATAAAMLAHAGITKEITEKEIIDEIRETMLAEKKSAAQLEAMSQLGENMAQLQLLQNMMGGGETVAAPAPAPAAPAESRMTMPERKAMIRDMVGSGVGTNQFRRHCSTTAQANAARAKIEEWRSKGYITGGQKAELRAEVNAAAWLGHCGVTATR